MELSSSSTPFLPAIATTKILNYRPFTFPYQVIIAHGPGCKDGVTAAWAWWRLLPQDYRWALQACGGFFDKIKRKSEYSSASVDSLIGALDLQLLGFPVVFAFAQHNDEIPLTLIKNKTVLILDLDLGDELVKVVQQAAFTMLCDHHTSTMNTFNKHQILLFPQNKFDYYIDTRKTESGASLSWKLSHHTDVPLLVDIVRVGDTWQFDNPSDSHLHAKEILRTMHFKGTFNSFPSIEEEFFALKDNFWEYAEQGITLLQHDRQIVKLICRQCDLGILKTNDGTTYTIAYVQCNIMHSEVGASMRFYAEKRFPSVKIDFCATWKYASHRNIISVSLRDAKPGIELSTVARNVAGANGLGGGHDTSASFMFEGLENFHKFIQRPNTQQY
jgi:hypothetical protein